VLGSRGAEDALGLFVPGAAGRWAVAGAAPDGEAPALQVQEHIKLSCL